MTLEQALLIIIAAIILFGIYFIPTFVAGNRQAAHFSSIFVINLCLGWNPVGWTAAMVWALNDAPRRRHNFNSASL